MVLHLAVVIGRMLPRGKSSEEVAHERRGCRALGGIQAHAPHSKLHQWRGMAARKRPPDPLNCTAHRNRGGRRVDGD